MGVREALTRLALVVVLWPVLKLLDWLVAVGEQKRLLGRAWSWPACPTLPACPCWPMSWAETVCCAHSLPGRWTDGPARRRRPHVKVGYLIYSGSNPGQYP
jgi:hypothetical protein